MNDVIYAGQQPHAYAIPPQHGDCWRVFYFTQGTGAYTAGSIVLPYQPGTILVFPPDAAPAHTADSPTQGILLHIRRITLVFRQPYALQDDANSSILHLMQDVLWHFSSALGDSALLNAYGQLIVQHVSSSRPSAPRAQLVQDLAQSILQNYTNPLYELDELLKSAPYCYDYLCRLFRQEMHTTPHKYLADLRLQAAADQLAAGNSSVSEVARLCGHHDPLYFSRMFKKKYGVSPREYARRPQEE